MKKLKFALAALILTSALAFTGCRDAGDDSAGQNNGQVESNGSNVFLAAAVPNTSEALTALNPDVSSMPGLEGSFTSEPEVSSAPQGNCPDCDGTGHHNNTVCGTCKGSGLYREPAASQGNCPDCNGTGHHNNAVCGTCGGSGLCREPAAPQRNCPDCDGTGHHNNTVCGTCNGSGWCAVQSHHKGGHHQNRSHH